MSSAFIEKRVLEIETRYAHLSNDIVILNTTEETLKLVLFLVDGTTLRIAERWKGNRLIRYSYYWLTSDKKLIIGWDNAPHHRKVATFPHHKHIGESTKVVPSEEHSLEEVMNFIQRKLEGPGR